MNGLERLLQENIQEVSRRTYIPVEELRRIFDREYKAFNRAKAIGFLHILEREYDVDLSEWMEEYNAHTGENEEEDEIFLVAETSDEMEMKKKILLFSALVLVVALAFFYLVSGDEASREEAAVNQTPAVVLDAQKELEAAKTETAPETDTATEEEAVATEATPLPEETQTPEAPAESESAAFFLETPVPLWVGITYADGKTLSTTVTGTYQLDPSRDQEIKFGHGSFRLTYGDTVFDPKSRQIQRFRLKDGVLEHLGRESGPVEPEAGEEPISPDDIHTQVPLEEIDR